jgi:hypothetical protein
MKKIGILCFAIMLFGAVQANAQGAIDRILDKVDKASDKADKANNTANRAGSTAGKLSGLFGKKKGTADAGTGAETKTTLNISGVDFATLKSITEKVENTKGVVSAKMKFNTAGSSIGLQHIGTTDDLLKALQKTNPTVFAEKNILGMEDGQISITLKK